MSLKQLLKVTANSFLDLLFPKSCLHCQEEVEADQFLCQSCLTQLQALDPHEHCPICFDYIENGRRICPNCLKNPSFLFRFGSVFEHSGPAITLLQKVQEGQLPDLVQGLAAFMLVQFQKLEWPLPDCIVPIPLTLEKRFGLKENVGFKLAQQLGAFLDRPVCSFLKYSLLDFKWKLKADSDLQDKVVLLIDDLLVSHKTFNECAFILQKGYPAKIYGFTFSSIQV